MRSSTSSGAAGTWDEHLAKLDSEISSITGALQRKQKEFDEVMALVRDTIRESAQAITLLHNGKEAEARKRLAAAYVMVKGLRKHDGDFNYHSRQAYQEYAEARIFYIIKGTGAIPTSREVGVDGESYIMGLMDVMGELKREILEALREQKLREAETYFSRMRTIYDSTRSIRFAEAVLNGFRKKQDVARIQVENAGSEILSFKSRRG